MTGAAGGIGRATAERLAADSATVVVNYIGDPEPAEDLVREIEAEEGAGRSPSPPTSHARTR